jgi:acetoacetyl-CoA synthetase
MDALNSRSKDDDLLWQPNTLAVEESPTCRFIARVNSQFQLNPTLESYEDLYRWSVDPRTLSSFWSTVWDEVGIIGEKGRHVVGNSADGVYEGVPSENPAWFEEARVNWAENMLRFANTEVGRQRTAMIQVSE